MPRPLRYTLATIAGIVVAVVVITVIELVGHIVHPVPAGLDPNDTQALRDFIDTLPVGAFLFVVAAWIAGTFSGGLVGALIAGRRPHLIAGIVGALVLVATIANLIAIPHPAWVAIGGVLGILLAAWAAGSVVARRSEGPRTA